MQLNPLPFTPQAFKPTPPPTPAAQAAFVTAALVSQPTAAPTRTQTAQAPQATGKADGTRNAQNGTDTPQSKDTLASAVNARTNGVGYGQRHRGTQLDVTV